MEGVKRKLSESIADEPSLSIVDNSAADISSNLEAEEMSNAPDTTAVENSSEPTAKRTKMDEWNALCEETEDNEENSNTPSAMEIQTEEANGEEKASPSASVVTDEPQKNGVEKENGKDQTNEKTMDGKSEERKQQKRARTSRFSDHKPAERADGRTEYKETPTKEMQKHPKSRRLKGVFPDAIQPIRTVIVADSSNPLLDTSLFVQNEKLQVLLGENMDCFDFMDVISNKLQAKEDDTLYVVVPSFSFIFKSLSIFCDDKEEENPKLVKAFDVLYDIFDEFKHLIDLEDLRMLRKCLSAADASGKKSVFHPILEEFLRQLFYSALFMRNIVRTNTVNSEMIFCGFALHDATSNAIRHILTSKLPPATSEMIVNSLILAVFMFNEFCSNTWALGGFDFKDLSLTQYSDLTEKPKDSDNIEERLKEFTVQLMPDSDSYLLMKNFNELMYVNEESELEKLKKRFTSSISVSLLEVLKHQKMGNVLPWEKVEAEEFEGLPTIIKSSLESGLYKEITREDESVLFECKHCMGHLNVRDAESHQYTQDFRKFALKINISPGNDEMKAALRVKFGDDSVNINKCLLQRLTQFSIATQGEEYKCMVCVNSTESMDKDSFRIHLNEQMHHQMLNSHFGTNTSVLQLKRQQHWPLVREMSRLPASDVVILTDEIHKEHLDAQLNTSTKIHLLSVPSLVSNDLSESRQTIDSHVATKSVLSNALWLIVAGKDVLDCDKTVQVLQKHYSYLTRKLPISHRVVIAPLMPLNVTAPDTPNVELLKTFTNSVVSDSLSADKYRNLYKEVMSLHRTTATLANVKSLSKLHCSAVKVLRDIAVTPWHIALKSFILSALHGMETEFLRIPTPDINLQKFELEHLQKNVKIVHPYLQLKLKFESPKEETVPKLVFNINNRFDECDSHFIMSELEERKPTDSIMWYVGCDISQMLFSKERDIDICLERNCSLPLKLIGKNELTVDEMEEKIMLFMVTLQNKMPKGNVLQLLPLYPSAVVSVNIVKDEVDHSLMHSLGDSVQFTHEDQALTRERVSQFVERYDQLMLRFNRMHYISREDIGVHKCLSIEELKTYQSEEDEKKWFRTFNSLLKNLRYSNEVSFEASSAEKSSADEQRKDSRIASWDW